MKKVLIAQLVILTNVLIGLIALLVFQSVKLPEWLHSSLPILIAFLLINLLNVRIFSLQESMTEFWSIKKIKFLGIGVLAGAVMIMLPGLMAWLLGYAVSFNPQFNLYSILITLLIVSWEELWFRGLFLNHAKKHISAINLSLIMGLLFMLIHVFNPNIDLMKTGPTLFLAGACLTLLYFYFKTIWLPLGMHFGNNYFGDFIAIEAKNHLVFGAEGYANAIILAALFLIFIFLSKQNDQTSNN